MNIWIVNQHAYTYSESAGTRHLSLGRELAESGHTVTIVASSFYHKERRYIRDSTRIHDELISGVRFVWVPARRYDSSVGARLVNHLQFATRAIAWARGAGRVAPDVVVGSAPNHISALAAARIARHWAVPFVYEIRDLWPETLADYSRFGSAHPLVPAFAVVERNLIAQAAHVVSLLPGAGARIRRLGGRDVPVTWISNGVDLAYMQEASRTTNQQVGRRPGDLHVLYAGSHSMSNGLDPLLDAAHRLLLRQAPVRITFVGGGPAKVRLQHRAVVLGLRNVEFIDAVPKGEVYGAMRGADVLIANVPGRNVYRYGISLNKIFEYMAVGRPIVLGYSGNYDPVRAAGCGITVPADSADGFANALEWLAHQSEDRRLEFGHAGAAYAVQNYSYTSLARKWVDVLSQVGTQGREECRTGQ